MTIYYNTQDRKPLVKAISEFTGADAVYMRTPTYAYPNRLFHGDPRGQPGI